MSGAYQQLVYLSTACYCYTASSQMTDDWQTMPPSTNVCILAFTVFSCQPYINRPSFLKSGSLSSWLFNLQLSALCMGKRGQCDLFLFRTWGPAVSFIVKGVL